MKKFFLMLLVFAIPALVQAENVIINGSFETGDASDWWTEQTGTAAVSISDSMASSGTYSLLATSAGTNWTEEARFGNSIEFEASVEGDEITIYFDYYAVSGGLIGINIDYYTDAKHWLGWSEITPTTGEWVNAEITYTLPTGTYALDVKFIVTGESEIYFDNFTTDPSPISLTSPPDGDEIGTDVTLEWSYLENVDTIDLYLGTEDDPNLTDAAYLVLSNEPSTTSSYSTTLAPATYYWKVVGYMADGQGGTISKDSAVWSFTIVEAPEIVTMTPYGQSVPGDGSTDATIAAAGYNLDTASAIWSKNGIELSTSDLNYSGADSTTLTIHDVTLEDEGIYSCRVYNTEGEDTANAVVVTERLISWWKLDGNLDDSVQEAVPGAQVFNGTVDPQTVFTADGSGLDGGDSVILGIDDPNCPFLQIDGTEEMFNFYEDSLTVNAWIRTSYVSSSAWPAVMSKSNGSKGYFAALDGESQALSEVDGNRVYSNIPDLADDQWHMVTVTYDGSIQKVYVDGNLRATGSAGLANASGNAAPIIIGAWNSTSADADFDGNIDNVMIYSKVLTGTEIGEFYVANHPGVDSICNYELPGLDFDTNGNCRIDIADFANFAATWLNCNLIPASACDN